MTTGLILAGGHATRFADGDKAVATLAGQPLIRHVAEGLATSCDRLLVSCRRPQQAAIRAALAEYSLPVQFVIDDRACGPLGGIEDGLSQSDSPWTLVVGCDFPLVDTDTIAALEPAPNTDAVVFETDGTLQPLCGRYRTLPAEAAAARLLARGEQRARQLPAVLRTSTISAEAVDFDLQHRLQNINTTDELAGIAADFDE